LFCTFRVSNRGRSLSKRTLNNMVQLEEIREYTDENNNVRDRSKESISIRAITTNLVDVSATQEEVASKNNEASMSKGHKKDVYGPRGAIDIIFGIDVTAINRIDDASQEVDASIYCKFRYPCYREKHEIWDAKNKRWKDKPWELSLDQGWSVQNLTHLEHSKVRFFPEEEDEYGGMKVTWLAVTMKLDGVFAQKFALQRYPFDSQKIVFEFGFWGNPYAERGKLLDGRLEIREDVPWKCRVQPGACRCADEWSLKHPRLKLRMRTTKESPKYQRSFIILQCQLTVKRKPGFITWNIIVPTFLVVLIGIAGVLVSRDLGFDRFAHTGTMVLTLFAIKFSISFALPKIGYATTLDLYLLTGVMILLGVAVQIALTSHYDEYIREIDLITAFTLIAFWITVTLSLRQISKLLPLLINLDKYEEHDLV